MKRIDSRVVIVALAIAAMHLGAILAWPAGVSAAGLTAFGVMYLIRGFGITAGYHRYFAHRAYATNRGLQFVLALMGTLAFEGGVLWWVARHREHHRYTDTAADPHSPGQGGFWHAHIGWMLSTAAFARPRHPAKEWLAYPELAWLQRHYVWLVLLPLPLLYGLGEWLAAADPTAGTGGGQLVCWGYCLSQIVVWHSTFMVNSVCHVWGSAPYATGDSSRNNLFVALLTLGEGWHNNHHHAPYSARQGLRWYQIDPTWWLLRLLQAVGLARDLRHARDQP